MHELGALYEYGRVAAPGAPAPATVAPDYARALEWYRRAADKPHAPSLYHLALMHAYGRGTRIDHARALLLFDQAADLLHVGAMYYLGVMTLYGHGVPVDYTMALTWFRKAAQFEDPVFSPPAEDAHAELSAAIANANAANKAALARFETPLVEDAAGVETVGVS